jgi:hypothetical protein
MADHIQMKRASTIFAWVLNAVLWLSIFSITPGSAAVEYSRTNVAQKELLASGETKSNRCVSYFSWLRAASKVSHWQVNVKYAVILVVHKQSVHAKFLINTKQVFEFTPGLIALKTCFLQRNTKDPLISPSLG